MEVQTRNITQSNMGSGRKQRPNSPTSNLLSTGISPTPVRTRNIIKSIFFKETTIIPEKWLKPTATTPRLETLPITISGDLSHFREREKSTIKKYSYQLSGDYFICYNVINPFLLTSRFFNPIAHVTTPNIDPLFPFVENHTIHE